MTHDEYWDDEIPEENWEDRKSKSRIKREMNALQSMGESLVDLAPTILKQMNLPEEILDAVLDARSMSSREAKRRQIQYIGALMRQVDTEAISRQLRDIADGRRMAARSFHAVEAWRDRLVAGDETVMDELIEKFGSLLDIQHLRQLVRNAGKEKPPAVKSSRALFRFLKDLEDSAPAEDL